MTASSTATTMLLTDYDTEDVLEDARDGEETEDVSEDDDLDNQEVPVYEHMPSAIFAKTAFDHYFSLNHKPAKTSSTVFSHKVAPITREEYDLGIAASSHRTQSLQIPWLRTAPTLFPRFLTQLDAGFNLLFYGAGSKHEVLTSLAGHINKRKRDVLVVNGFNPQCTLKSVLASIEAVPGVLEAETAGPSSGIEAQARRIHHFFSAPDSGDKHLYIVIHSLDAPPLRLSKSLSALALLASAPRIHVAASVDNIAWPHLWSFTEASTRKSTASATGNSLSSDSGSADQSSGTGTGGFAWLYHDLTTLAPYTLELAHADRSSLRGATTSYSRSGRSKDIPGAAAPGAGEDLKMMTESAARHVLASVTQKAKRLFVLLGRRQLGLMDNQTDGKDGGAPPDPATISVDYSTLFGLARDDFVATNDTTLRALMGEFRDHGLMRGADAIWIPLRREVLRKVVEELGQEK